MDAEDIGAENLIIRSCSSALGISQLVRILSKHQSKRVAIQLFDYGSIANRTHLVGAYINARLAVSGCRNMSKSLSMEMLLFAAMTKQITEAIERVGAKSPKRFVLFSNDVSAYREIKKYMKSDTEFKATRKHEISAVSRLGVKPNGSVSEALLQAMAVARLRD